MKALTPDERKLLFNALGVVAGLAIVAFSKALEGLILGGICWIIDLAVNGTGAAGLVKCTDITSVVLSGLIASTLVIVGLAVAAVCFFKAVFILIKIMREKKKMTTTPWSQNRER